MARAATTTDLDGSPVREPALASTLAVEDPPGPGAGSLLSAFWEKWNSVDADRLAAAVAFYTILSLAPLLILVVAVGSWWVGADATQHYLSTQIAELIGREGGELVDALVNGRDLSPPLHGWGAWIGMAITSIGATATFAELQHALNRIFGEVRRPAMTALLRARVLSFGLVLGTGFLLVMSLVLSAALTVLVDRGAENASIRAGAIVNELAGFAVITIAFAALLRVLPDRPPHGRQVWTGAIVSAALFAGGKYAIGWYVTRLALGSAYGAAGTVVVIMLWIYFSAATFLAGAVLASVVTCGRRAIRADRAASESGKDSVARQLRTSSS
jgi:membrane protein